ncbi:MAG: hypothetical protein ACTHKT_00875 [Solirubrobacterales bacterium]
MNELVHWILHSRFLSSARVSSVAGSGLPERMRSTAFVLLGLTAAAGLALVAIFAQLGFPLLEPAPLPAEPSANESIAAAEKVAPDHGPVALRAVQPLRPAPSPPHAEVSPSRPSSDGAGGSPVAEGPAAGGPGGAAAPAPSSGNKNGGSGAGGEPGGSNPTPPAVPEPAPSAVPAPPPTASVPPAPVPKPTTPPPPPPVTATPAPEPVAPGNSSSAAAAAHASERGIEASSGGGNGKGQDK